jgi:hypothetical protein
MHLASGAFPPSKGETMPPVFRFRAVGGAATAVFLLLAACASPRQQLESVAKDWSMTIRASQVVPVYPLTEDLQPGDVFLVQIPIDRQQQLYRENGFLPLDNHLVRLDPRGYVDFYRRAFRDDFGSGELPRSQQRPAQGKAWSTAPQTGFPSYSFSVRQGASLSLALPVQGVPVGLGLLGANAADGTVSLKDARTLGIDTVSLFAQLQDWAQSNRTFLAHFGAEKPRNYLRIVSRIYLACQVDVSLRNADQQGAGLEAGKTGPLAMLASDPQAGAAQGYAEALKSINSSIDAAMSAVARDTSVGGKLRLTAASAHSVAMTETFDPPLVFGYLGFDVPILDGGDLGAPIPTHANLTQEITLHDSPELQRTLELGHAAVTRRIYLTLQQIKNNAEARTRVQALDALAALVPASDSFFQTERGDVLAEVSWKPDPETTGYLRFHDWHGRMEQSHKVLDRLLKGSKLSLKSGAAAPTTVSRGSYDWTRLEQARDEYARRLQEPAMVAAMQEASRAAWRAFYRLTTEEEP